MGHGREISWIKQYLYLLQLFVEPACGEGDIFVTMTVRCRCVRVLVCGSEFVQTRTCAIIVD